MSAPIADLARRLANHCPGLPEPIPPEASLTGELGVDSIGLMGFLAEIRIDYDVELGPWIIHQTTRGRDSLRTLANHLAALECPRTAQRRVGNG